MDEMIAEDRTVVFENFLCLLVLLRYKLDFPVALRHKQNAPWFSQILSVSSRMLEIVSF